MLTALSQNVVDIATLTGAVVGALENSPLECYLTAKNTKFWPTVEIRLATGFWQLPLWKIMMSN